jgi:phosphoglycerol transferase MdoB-like AlkP superfamily enzyme
MPPALAFLTRSLPSAVPGGRAAWAWAVLIALHFSALGVLLWSEVGLVPRVAFLLTWGTLNFLLLAMLRRPMAAAALTLALMAGLIVLSLFKHDVLLMTVNFLDIMIVDLDSVRFLLAIYPNLIWIVGAAVMVLTIAAVVLWYFDPFRVRFAAAVAGALLCFTGLGALSLAAPNDLYQEFDPNNFVSKFARTGFTSVYDLYTRGYLESDASASSRLPAAEHQTCAASPKRPHIVMVFDEGSFDLTRVPGVKAWPGYSDHFRSFDGKSRALLVEGAGGPSWYTEYNVLTGLSVKSFGRFADFVTRIAADRVERGLPRTLVQCGYKTFSIYPMWGWFGGARQFQTTAGIQRFLDARDLGSNTLEPDRFYFDKALALMKRERGNQPMFMFVYTAANHFPWNFRFRPDLTPDWQDIGNGNFEVDEYLRRQSLSVRDYADFVAGLKREFGDEPVLIVRFGDHQPSFAKTIMDPALDESVLARRIAESDPRYVTTYYAIEGINFRPADLSSALDTLDAPYLPLVVLEAAGLPLDPAFAEQKRILQRCSGLFYKCANGAEARRFNRLLIDAGLISGL